MVSSIPFETWSDISLALLESQLWSTCVPKARMLGTSHYRYISNLWSHEKNSLWQSVHSVLNTMITPVTIFMSVVLLEVLLSEIFTSHLGLESALVCFEKPIETYFSVWNRDVKILFFKSTFYLFYVWIYRLHLTIKIYILEIDFFNDEAWGDY